MSQAVPHELNPRTGVIFRRTLRDNLTAIISWGLGYSLLIAAVAFLYPVLQKNNTLLGIANGLELFGFSRTNADIELTAFTTFGGYLGIMALNLAPHILAIFMIPQALSAVAREEERGTLDILLSTPIPRWRYLVEKTLAIVVSFIGILVIMWVSLILCIMAVKQIDLSVINATAGIWHIFPVSLTIMSLTLLISVSVRNSRSAGSLTAMIILVNYFWRTVLNWVEIPILSELKPLTIFYYYRSVATLSHGFDNLPLDLTMLVVAVILFAAALWQFNRRDIGT